METAGLAVPSATTWGAAMTAHIDECAHLAVSIADQKNRHAADFEGAVGVVFAKFRREGEHEGESLEDPIDLVLPAFGVGVVTGGDAEDFGRLVDGARRSVSQMPFGQINQLFATHGGPGALLGESF